MNRIKKIRGHKKIQKRIQNWIEQNRIINIGDFLANKYCYTHISFEPYFNISINNSNIAEPKTKTRKQIVLGLQEIYNNWKIELDKLNQPYFLKIYLFEPRISKSQVICAIGKEKIEYYENFYQITDNKSDLNFQKILSPGFKWRTHSDDDMYSEQELLTPESYYHKEDDYNYCKRLLKKLQKKNYTKIKTEDEYGEDYLYYVPKGKVLIGGK
ncbi:hypothetical protein [Flavobacterium sp. LC2016-12]|uniref:hypothetical protein n=1 Tax=Flavobacterium sp. LC2016-12 TaxID=2783794 RepID=UPI00188D4677|nr:hypothetical protein [Flavobacterium sp. LC2016-12]MBF4465163.1 hypothetical protein [Flavobacterium sp. LC2016-12]